MYVCMYLPLKPWLRCQVSQAGPLKKGARSASVRLYGGARRASRMAYSW